MSDIFLSYAREDLQRARQLAEALERRGWAVFWDPTIPAGQRWRQYIGKKLDEARCVVVAWSTAAIESHWVLEEAEAGRGKNALVPVLIESVTAPFGFRGIQAEDLSSWDGSESFPAFEKLARDLEALLGPAPTKVPARSPRVQEPPKAVASHPSSGRGRVFQDALKDGSRGPAMVVVPAGEFQMGDVHDFGGADEKPVHTVRIAKPFAIGKYPVTFEEYDQYVNAVRLKSPSDGGWGRGRRPVINVSWPDAVKFCEWLSEEAGKHDRLPSEAEWEYAARSGDKDETWAGTFQERELGGFAWYNANSGSKTQPVGTKKPNGLGLYDMSGNVWEWVQDCWHDNYNGAPTDGSAPKESGGGRRVVRGGSWDSKPVYLRSSNRDKGDPAYRNYFVGFRLAQDIQ